MGGSVSISDQKAETVATALMKDDISRFGVHHILHSDRGTNFEGSVMREVYKLLG